LDKVADGASHDESFLFEIGAEPEKKIGQPLQRRFGGVLENRARLFGEPGLVMVRQGEAECLLALEIEIKGALGHAGRLQDFLQAGGGESLVVDDAPAASENMFTGIGCHGDGNRSVVYGMSRKKGPWRRLALLRPQGAPGRAGIQAKPGLAGLQGLLVPSAQEW